MTLLFLLIEQLQITRILYEFNIATAFAMSHTFLKLRRPDDLYLVAFRKVYILQIALG